ncbi:hypothetical protein [Streptomyces sp. MST-110588]|uniref:hypothetical protein n=1 Tax=Streptomyces sp. MST-110588 TaxID=2833628 RepID=UPI001F5D8B15|nr:hypothetical protein [Streptomyces sp. MST-110588]UNO39295.1 hypothetical protein KGS77_06245 [Streptomyces sp. MST-110588]
MTPQRKKTDSALDEVLKEVEEAETRDVTNPGRPSEGYGKAGYPHTPSHQGQKSAEEITEDDPDTGKGEGRTGNG